MVIVKITRVLSSSSEDPRYPACNLLDADVSKSWRCKEAGEKQAVVILQLERSSKISGIDIGNDNSAFVEIFVGRSAAPDEFHELRVASLLMTVPEAKTGTKKNTVRFFKSEEFVKSTAEESWDRLKITCSQPFNKQIAYGLSFIKVHTKDAVVQPKVEETKNSSAVLKKECIGRFNLKPDPGHDDVAIGSFFAKRNEITTTAASIKAASSDPETLRNSVTIKRLSDLIPPDKAKKKKEDKDDDENTKMESSRRCTTGALLYDDDDEDPLIDKVNTDSNASTALNNHVKSPRVNNQIPKEGKPTSKEKKSIINPDLKKKPFNKLLSEVVFVISGFQNPYRSQLRNMATSMGALYKADWDSSCTHLICAFPNTPKAAVVRNKGWIVKKNWIEDCHSRRKRLKSSDYKLDKNDTYIGPDDEEIHEQIEEVGNDRENYSESQSLSFKAVNPLRNTVSSGSPEIDIYDADTDVEDDAIHVARNPKHEDISLPVLPSFFSNIKFYFGSDITDKLSGMLTRYITAYKGQVITDVHDANFVISEDIRYKDNISRIPVMLPDWIWECNDQKKIVASDEFSL